MSFEEQFPNTNLTYCEILQEDKRQGICTGMIEQEECLKKHLSKQRVKEVFNKHRYCGLVCENRFNEKTSNGNCVDNILEELEIKHNYNLGYPARKIEPLSQNQYLDLKEILGL